MGVTFFFISSTSEYFTMYFFPNLSNFEFHCVTICFKLVFLQSCKGVYFHLNSGFLFSEMLGPIGLLGAWFDEINYKISKTPGYCLIMSLSMSFSIETILCLNIFKKSKTFFQDAHQNLEP